MEKSGTVLEAVQQLAEQFGALGIVIAALGGFVWWLGARLGGLAQQVKTTQRMVRRLDRRVSRVEGLLIRLDERIRSGELRLGRLERWAESRPKRGLT